METFWANNYLVEQLLPFLDLPSTVALASVHTVTASLIKRDFLWKQLLHQTFKTKSDFLVVYKEKVDLLITLIKQLDDVDEHQLHQSLFHHICKRFPPTSASSILMSWAGGEPATERVLSQMGFLLLERVKKSPFLVRRVYTKKYNLKFGQVLEAALEQQGEQAGTLDCTSKQADLKDLQSLKNLIPHCQCFEFALTSRFWDCYWNNEEIYLNHGRLGGWEKDKEAWTDLEKLLEVDSTRRKDRSWVSGRNAIGEMYQFQKL